MAPAGEIEVRPRTAGEILDDAWRLYLGQPLLLFSLSGLFTLPFVVALLVLLTLPRPEAPAASWVLPAVAALLLPLTGLGSGACQEAFRRKAEGGPVTFRGCLGAALRRGREHVAARAVISLAILLGILCVVLPGLIVWVGTAVVHPLLAGGEARLGAALKSAGREVQRYPAKAMVVTLSRPLLVVFAALNLHVFARTGIWVADQLAGFDMPLLGVLLSLKNVLYDTVLLLFSWLLLTPYAEAVNYLLHSDARARFEGLDLWYRVQRLFPVAHKTRAGLILLALGAGLALEGTARASDRLDPVRAARRDIAKIEREVGGAATYPGGARWARRLEHIAERLDPGGSTRKGGYRWFRQAIDGFGHRHRDDALRVLRDLQRRLAALEASLAQAPTESPRTDGQDHALSKEEIKALLPQPNTEDDSDDKPPEDRPMPEKEPEVKRPVARDEADAAEPRRRGSGAVLPRPPGGFSAVGWLLLAGLLAAVIAATVVLFLQGRSRSRALAKAPPISRSDLPPESLVAQPDQQTASNLWQQAEDLARQGDLLEAVRRLYLGVLALLHRAGVIRYERNRTNGEYVAQLRPHASLQQPFRSLTGLFELTWYGGYACRPEDFAACRGMVERLRGAVQDL